MHNIVSILKSFLNAAQTHLCGFPERGDLVQRDKRNPLLELTSFQNVFADSLVLDDDVVQSSSSGDLQRSRLVAVLLREVDERRDETFDFTAIEALVRGCVLEVKVMCVASRELAFLI